MAATLKVHKWHTWNVCVRLFIGLHKPYQKLPSASMDNGTVNFAAEHRWSTRQAITVIQMRKTSVNDWVLLIVILALELFFSDSQALHVNT